MKSSVILISALIGFSLSLDAVANTDSVGKNQSTERLQSLVNSSQTETDSPDFDYEIIKSNNSNEIHFRKSTLSKPTTKKIEIKPDAPKLNELYSEGTGTRGGGSGVVISDSRVEILDFYKPGRICSIAA